MQIKLNSKPSQYDSETYSILPDGSIALKYNITSEKQSKMFGDLSLVNTLSMMGEDSCQNKYPKSYQYLNNSVKKSLFKKNNKFQRQNKIKVFYFSLKKSYDFDTFELEQLNYYMPVRKFIQIAVLKYLQQCTNFVPSKIKTQSFSLTMIEDIDQFDLQANTNKILDHDQKIRLYNGTHLLLLRLKNKDEKISIFEKTNLNCNIYQISLTFENSQTLLKLNKNKTVSDLIIETLKKSKSIKPISEFLLLQYNSLKIYPITEFLQNISEYKFQLFDRKQQLYEDKQWNQSRQKETKNKKDKIYKNIFTLFVQNHKYLADKKKVKAQIRLGFFETMTLEIVDNQFVETYNEGKIFNKILELIFEKELVVRYSFGNLISAYVQQNYLVLIFCIKKKKNIVKKYKMESVELRIFSQEIARLAQLFRKKLLDHPMIQ